MELEFYKGQTNAIFAHLPSSQLPGEGLWPGRG